MSEDIAPYTPRPGHDAVVSSDGVPFEPGRYPQLALRDLGTAAPKGRRWWAFLRYGGLESDLEGDYDLMNLRWIIETRDGEEGFWVVSPWQGAPTHECAVPGIAYEMELAMQAIEQLRAQGGR